MKVVKLHFILFLFIPLTVLSNTLSQKRSQFFLKTVDELKHGSRLYRESQVSHRNNREKVKVFLSFRAFIKAIIAYNREHLDDPIDSVKSYKKNRKYIEGAPGHPEEVYKGEWKGWGFIWKQCEKEFHKSS